MLLFFLFFFWLRVKSQRVFFYVFLWGCLWYLNKLRVFCVGQVFFSALGGKEWWWWHRVKKRFRFGFRVRVRSNFCGKTLIYSVLLRKMNHARSYSRQDERWKATGNWKPSVSADSKPILKVFRIELKVLNLA